MTRWVIRLGFINGAFVGMVPDHLKNQVHYIKTDENPGKPFDLNGLSGKDLKAYGQKFRSLSIAFIGSKTLKDMQSIANQSDKAHKEIGFVGEISAPKKLGLKLCQLTS